MCRGRCVQIPISPGRITIGVVFFFVVFDPKRGLLFCRVLFWSFSLDCHQVRSRPDSRLRYKKNTQEPLIQLDGLWPKTPKRAKSDLGWKEEKKKGPVENNSLGRKDLLNISEPAVTHTNMYTMLGRTERQEARVVCISSSEFFDFIPPKSNRQQDEKENSSWQMDQTNW